MLLELCYCGCGRSKIEVIIRLRQMFELDEQQANMMYDLSRTNKKKMVEALSA